MDHKTVGIETHVSFIHTDGTKHSGTVTSMLGGLRMDSSDRTVTIESINPPIIIPPVPEVVIPYVQKNCSDLTSLNQKEEADQKAKYEADKKAEADRKVKEAQEAEAKTLTASKPKA